MNRQDEIKRLRVLSNKLFLFVTIPLQILGALMVSHNKTIAIIIVGLLVVVLIAMILLAFKIEGLKGNE